jgi:predicted dinucleotide-binding enzyme
LELIAPGAKNRRALVIAGNDKDAKAGVTHLLDQFGFDAVDAGRGAEAVAQRRWRNKESLSANG